MSTTLLALEQLLSQSFGDDLEFDTTTNVAASTKVIKSTTLQNYDGGHDGYFDNWWVYITEGVNIGVNRQVSAGTTYLSSSGQITVMGANLSAETAAVTCRLHRYNRDLKVNALKRAVEQLYPILHKPVDNKTLITSNMLPNGSFEDWAASTAPDFWSLNGVTAAANTTLGQHWGGVTSAHVTASTADQYLYLDSQNYPPLLDLSGLTVSFYAMAYPQAANDAFLELYTVDKAGSTQTLASTTACSSVTWTLLKLEEQKLNEDLTRLQARLRVHTINKYAIFDDAVLNGLPLTQYVLPADFQNGHLSQVMIQTTGYNDQPCYDMASQNWSVPQEFRVIRNSGYNPPSTYHVLNFNAPYVSNYRMRLIGYKQLETLSSDSATIFLDGERLNLIVAKAASIFWKSMQSPVSSQDKGRYFNEIAMWENEVNRLTYKFMMPLPSGTLWTGD